MAARLRDWLELVRIPNVFTAQADVLAGSLVAGAAASSWVRVLFLMLSSSLLYSAGMVLNDYYDYATDIAERPERPLPSGRIGRKTALVFALCLMGAGVLAAWFAGRGSLLVSIFLSAAILSYDGGVKRHFLFGPLNMGVCRYCNFLLGLSVLPLANEAFLFPVLTGLFITGVTAVSRHEAGEFARLPVLVGIGTTAAVPLCFFVLKWRGLLPEWSGLALCLLWAGFILWHLFRLLAQRNAHASRRVVKYMILGLVGLDGVIVAGARGVFWALPVWALLIPAACVGKKFYST